LRLTVRQGEPREREERREGRRKRRRTVICDRTGDVSEGGILH